MHEIGSRARRNRLPNDIFRHRLDPGWDLPRSETVSGSQAKRETVTRSQAWRDSVGQVISREHYAGPIGVGIALPSG